MARAKPGGGQPARLRRLVHDLVDWGALRTGTLRLSLGVVRLRPVLEACRDRYRDEARERGLTLECGLDRRVPATINADEARLYQVLCILLENALEVTNEGGVSLLAQCGCPPGGASGRAAAGLVWAGQWLEIRVADTGPGMPPTARAKLFRAFKRWDYHERTDGSGIRLALAYRLCEAMGGRLDAESDGARGATFIVRLPLGECVEAPARAEEFPAVVPTQA